MSFVIGWFMQSGPKMSIWPIICDYLICKKTCILIYCCPVKLFKFKEIG